MDSLAGLLPEPFHLARQTGLGLTIKSAFYAGGFLEGGMKDNSWRFKNALNAVFKLGFFDEKRPFFAIAKAAYRGPF